MPPTSMPHVRQKLLMGLAPRKPALRIVVLFAAFSALGEVFVSLVCSVFEMRLPMGAPSRGSDSGMLPHFLY